MNEISLLQSLSLVNRAAYQNRQVQAQKISDRSQELSVKILGYDADTGNYRVKDTTGKITFSRAISNSAALSKGNQVSLVSPIGGIPIIDAMPA